MGGRPDGDNKPATPIYSMTSKPDAYQTRLLSIQPKQVCVMLFVQHGQFTDPCIIRINEVDGRYVCFRNIIRILSSHLFSGPNIHGLTSLTKNVNIEKILQLQSPGIRA